MTKPELPALLFGGSPISALGFARSLARNGVTVYYVTDNKNEATFSRYLKECYVIPNIETDVKMQIDFLNKFQKMHPFSVVFPGSDIFCLNLACAKVKLENKVREGFHFLLAPEEIVETLANKRKFYHSISNCGIAHPPTYFSESLDDATRIGRELEYPVFVKPSISQVFAKVFGVKGFVAKSREELIKYYDLAMRHGIDVLIQEIIPGPNNQVFGINAYFDKKNNPRGLFVYRRIRGWPHVFGYGSLIESIPLSSMPDANTVVHYLHELGYHGLVDAEFKMDERDGNFKFLEVNPRVWVQNSFPTKCGINLDLMAYLDAIDNQAVHEGRYKNGIRWADSLSDFQSVIKMLRDGEISVSEWISSLHMIKDWAYSPLDDLVPWILDPLFRLRKYVQKKMPQNRTH